MAFERERETLANYLMCLDCKYIGLVDAGHSKLDRGGATIGRPSGLQLGLLWRRFLGFGQPSVAYSPRTRFVLLGLP